MDRTSGRPAATDDIVSHRFVTLEDAAAHLQVTTKTIRRFIAVGDLTGYRLGKRMLRVDLREVHDLARPIPTAAPRRSR